MWNGNLSPRIFDSFDYGFSTCKFAAHVFDCSSASDEFGVFKRSGCFVNLTKILTVGILKADHEPCLLDSNEFSNNHHYVTKYRLAYSSATSVFTASHSIHS